MSPASESFMDYLASLVSGSKVISEKDFKINVIDFLHSIDIIYIW